MEAVLLEIAIIAVLILVNGLFSMSELAVVSARRARLQPLANRGNRGAASAIALADNPRNFLSTVQIGITSVGIFAGAFGGATIVQLLAEQLRAVPVLGSYATSIAFISVVAAITYFSVIVGELIPKSFALNSPEKLAMLLSRPMTFISRLASPVVWLLSAPTTMFLRAFRVHATVEPPVTDEEIIGLIDIGTKAGVFETAEKDMIRSVIALERQPVTSLMTPRTEIAWIDASESQEEIWSKLMRRSYSQLPVGTGTLDNIQGYVTAKGLLALWLHDPDADLASVMRKPLYVPESASVLELLASFRESHSHMAIIVDEFGGIEGLVTTHDVAEAVVGELSNDQRQPESSSFRPSPDGSFLLDGRMSIFDFEEHMGLDATTFEKAAFDTMAGLALFEFGRIPSVGEKFRWGEFEFVVVSMDRNRICTLRVSRKTKPTNEDFIA